MDRRNGPLRVRGHRADLARELGRRLQPHGGARGTRGAQTFKVYGLLDLAATYTVPADRTTSLDANGIPTGFIRGARFGQATADNHYPQPFLGRNGARAVRLAFGVRF